MLKNIKSYIGNLIMSGSTSNNTEIFCDKICIYKYIFAIIELRNSFVLFRTGGHAKVC